ncbi:MAG TPA: hypothetical protein VK466_05215 [Terriglobales bacterium]|nr:hypothetical protein [Terriglobales bacterium]
MTRMTLQRLAGPGLVLTICSAAAAAPMPREGNFDFNYCVAGRSEVMQVSDQAIVGSSEGTAAIVSNIPGGPFDGQGSHCMGTWAVIDGQFSASGYCVTVDADGDKFLMDYKSGPYPAGQPEHGMWTATSGSGKYQGVVAKGSYKAIVQVVPAVSGGFQSCNRNTGTYKLK